MGFKVWKAPMGHPYWWKVVPRKRRLHKTLGLYLLCNICCISSVYVPLFLSKHILFSETGFNSRQKPKLLQWKQKWYTSSFHNIKLSVVNNISFTIKGCWKYIVYRCYACKYMYTIVSQLDIQVCWYGGCQLNLFNWKVKIYRC